ncbi:MAG: glycerophosphodiester phosphodiesterase [Rhodospirillales bacterium]
MPTRRNATGTIKTPPVIGHRGAAGHAPENTLAGIRKAAALGVRWVEFDVRLTRDDHPILFHDETLQRTTNGRGRISDLDWDDIGRLDAGGWFGPDYAGERIPTLEEAAALLASLDLGANVEIKASPGREIESGHIITALLQDVWPKARPLPLISSFQRDTVAAALAEAPEIPRALIAGKVPPDWPEILSNLACEGLHCRHDALTAKQADAVISAGFSLRCYTVNNDALARPLFAWGVESVFTDFPDRIRAG